MRTSSRRNPPCKRATYWGRGGAGALFTCSEDNTVLLLLRAEWVEQGGTWGVPGGGIGEGFFRTPMQPITDLAVFREKAEDEVREECGGLPPDMTHLAEGLPFTEYEDCGFRYVTFIVDLTKAQKDAWRPFSADGENDAFIWFPLDEVKAGHPLPDEYGDPHDIHFGVNFTMQNMPKKANPRRHNPMRFDLRYAQEDVTERLRGSRAVRSIVSPSLQAANVERMANSPHTFIVVIAPDHRQEVEGTPGAVTLGVGLRTVWEIDEDVGGLKKTREGIYTAFTYLHKLGDLFQTKMLPTEPLVQSLPDAEERSEERVFRPFYKMLDKHLDLLRDALGARAGVTDEMYLKGIHACVNSKMVREGYVGDWTQAFADLFPLCELTPASRPLLLPVFKRPEKDAMRLPQKAYDVFNNVIVPDFNAKFREFYNGLIPTLYGEVIWVG